MHSTDSIGPWCWGMGIGEWFGLGRVNFLPRGFSGAGLGFELKTREDSSKFLFLPRAKAIPVPHPAPPVRELGKNQKAGETQVGQVILT